MTLEDKIKKTREYLKEEIAELESFEEDARLLEDEICELKETNEELKENLERAGRRIDELESEYESN